MVISTFLFTIFTFAAAVSKDLQSLLICRFFSGFMGAGPLTLGGPLCGDIFSPKARGLPIVLFCCMVFTGSLIAPFIGGFIMMNKSLGWSWTQYIPGILGGVSFGALLLTMDESYQPVILANKAAHMRRRTGDWSIHAAHEEQQLDFRSILTIYLTRPLRMLIMDPVVFCMSLFAAFVYGLLYLFLTAYPFIFQEVHHMNPGVGGLPYIAIFVGMIFGAVAIASTQPWVVKKMAGNAGILEPEWRLPVAFPGAITFSGGLFWLGWSGHTEKVSWVAPMMSGLFTGFGLLTMFLPSMAYLVEGYPKT